MKKIGIKIGVLVFMLCGYFFIEPIKNILTYPINQVLVGRAVASHLYDESEAVASVPIVVADYVLEEDMLYIFPIDGKVLLPMDIMVCNVSFDSIEVVSDNLRYEIFHYNHLNVHLYQYVHAKNEIGSTSDFYAIRGSDVQKIAERLTIYYEKV